MKAYKVFVIGDEENCAYIAAESAGRAKYLALKGSSRSDITAMGAHREPTLDEGNATEGPITPYERLDAVDCEYWGAPVRFA